MATFIPIEFQKAFDKTEQTSISIKAKYTDSPNRLKSQFGGIPYWQAETPAPISDSGRTMVLLAQINFADVPNHPDLPKSGILQFFIPCDDDQYGANLDTVGGQSDLISHFWDSPQKENLCEWKGAVGEDDLTPIFGSHELKFAVKKVYAGIDTVECAEALAANPFEILEDIALNEDEEAKFYNAITEYSASHGHKLLGYPDYINEEPRDNSEFQLLLQIETDMDNDNDIMWGDNGTGQLFIRHEDLVAKKFDECWLYWDY